MKPFEVASADGLKLAAQEWGNPAGPEILFIHGFSQSRLCWARQAADGQLAAFRLVAFDLRGHGDSEKPLDDAYRADQRWADDLAAVMAAAGLRRPVLVGWSYGGRVIADYLRCHGGGCIAGVVFVAALTKNDGALYGPGMSFVRAMTSTDLAENIAATRAFLRACFARPPEAEAFETWLAFNMVVPPKVRTAVLARAPDSGDWLARLNLPVLVVHGTQDQIILPAMAQFTASRAPRAKLSLYQGIGHAPFWEDAARFGAELAAFASAAHDAPFLDSHPPHG